MNRFKSVVLSIIKIISFVVSMVFLVYGIYEQIVGPGGAERLLKKLNIPLSYNQAFLFSIVSGALFFITCILQEKLTGKSG